MHRAYVLIEIYTTTTKEEGITINNPDDYLQLIDPYFCSDVCSWWVEDLKPGRSYIFRVRSFNYVGMGDYSMTCTTHQLIFFQIISGCYCSDNSGVV